MVPSGKEGQRAKPNFTSAYQKSLKLATEHNLESFSFPSISTGALVYPIEEAAKVAIKAVISFLRMRKEKEATSLKEVVFVLFDSRTHEYYRSALEEINAEKLDA